MGSGVNPRSRSSNSFCIIYNAADEKKERKKNGRQYASELQNNKRKKRKRLQTKDKFAFLGASLSLGADRRAHEIWRKRGAPGAGKKVCRMQNQKSIRPKPPRHIRAGLVARLAKKLRATRGSHDSCTRRPPSERPETLSTGILEARPIARQPARTWHDAAAAHVPFSFSKIPASVGCPDLVRVVSACCLFLLFLLLAASTSAPLADYTLKGTRPANVAARNLLLLSRAIQ